MKARMTDAGMARLPNDPKRLVASLSGPWTDEADLPPELRTALNEDNIVRNAFESLTPGRRREFIRWVSDAKRPETREKRIIRTVELIRIGRSLTEEMMSKWSKN
jgi:uncharacterized protein YdeI (YjbR/CyaY-like superfamily)